MDQLDILRRCRTRAFGARYLPSYIRTPQYNNLPTERRLLLLLRTTGTKKTSRPHDKIYGLLGLLHSDELVNKIQVDYEEPFKNLYANISRMLIKETSDLSMLEHDLRLRDQESLWQWTAPVHCPSWTVDFRYLGGDSIWPTVAHSTHFTTDGRGLVVDGVCTGGLRSHWATDTPYTYTGPGSGYLTIKQFNIVYGTFLAGIAKRLGLSHEETFARWRRFAVQYIATTHPTKAERVASNTESFKEHREKVWNCHLTRQDISHILVYEFCCIEEEGECRFARCVSSLTREDLQTAGLEIWALKGAGKPYILQYGTDGTYRYKGYVTFVEDDEQIKLDEDFFATRGTERITIF